MSDEINELQYWDKQDEWYDGREIAHNLEEKLDMLFHKINEIIDVLNKEDKNG